MIIFSDEVIEQFKRDIASHAPERGGALLGPRHTNLVSRFLFDPQAKVTVASYSPSVQLIESVKQEELPAFPDDERGGGKALALRTKTAGR